MSIKEQIRAEIERLIKNPRLDEEYNPAYQCGLRDLRTFVDSLPEQPVEGLEEEITRYLREECSSDNEPSVSEIARHFYELGRNQVLQELYKGKIKPFDKIAAAWLDDESKATE